MSTGLSSLTCRCPVVSALSDASTTYELERRQELSDARQVALEAYECSATLLVDPLR
jgi:hypothetical protein